MKPKTKKDIEILAEGGHHLARILHEVAAQCIAGASAGDLDQYAEEKIRAAGGRPSFKGFGALGHEFPSSLCVSPNAMVVHGIPYTTLVFKEGDVVGLDLGMEYKGRYTDCAITVCVGEVSEEIQRLVRVTKECLELAIAQMQIGNCIGDIGYAVQARAQAEGFGIVRTLTGHGVGYGVHEDPKIPNYGRPHSGERIVEGAVLAIEPMLNFGTHEVITADDGWGIVTKDDKVAAHFEHTVAATSNGPKILTQ